MAKTPLIGNQCTIEFQPYEIWVSLKRIPQNHPKPQLYWKTIRKTAIFTRIQLSDSWCLSYEPRASGTCPDRSGKGVAEGGA